MSHESNAIESDLFLHPFCRSDALPALHCRKRAGAPWQRTVVHLSQLVLPLLQLQELRRHFLFPQRGRRGRIQGVQSVRGIKGLLMVGRE